MNSKEPPDLPLTDDSNSSPMLRPALPHRGLRISLLAALFLILLCLWLTGTDALSSTTWPARRQDGGLQAQLPLKAETAAPSPKAVVKVALEAHIMSKCPDARDCLRSLVVPTMEQVEDKVDFRLSFIGDIDADDSVHCMHGQTECLGNILALCASSLYPSPKISLGFSTCMISSYEDIPSRALIESCALEHGIDFGKLNGCASEEGKSLDMLLESVKRSRDAGVKYSCTVRLQEKVRCIMDGGEWRDCEGGEGVADLVRDVERIYGELNGV